MRLKLFLRVLGNVDIVLDGQDATGDGCDGYADTIIDHDGYVVPGGSVEHDASPVPDVTVEGSGDGEGSLDDHIGVGDEPVVDGGLFGLGLQNVHCSRNGDGGFEQEIG